MEGAIEIRERRDKVVKGGKDGSNVGNKGGKGKLIVSKGKFEEKGHEGYGRGRGKEVCSICYGTCCRAVRDLVTQLINIGKLRPDIKVSEFFKRCVFIGLV